MSLLEWIRREFHPKPCTSDTFIYDDMESQSGKCLPVIYKPFDPQKKSHWHDRGSIWDFILSTGGTGKRVLDYGPGDGWPSLPVAPYEREVIGVDSSSRRIDVCSDNARRLGITNAHFIHCETATPLPFDDDTFDAVMAASSIEQSPSPKDALRELFRVLRPEGRLRINYEALGQYRNGHERDYWVADIDDERSRLILFDRHIEEEFVDQYGVTLRTPKKSVLTALEEAKTRRLSFDDFIRLFLESRGPDVIDARHCRTVHPSGETLQRWLVEVGFSSVSSTCSGATAAASLFDRLAIEECPNDLPSVDKLIRPEVENAVLTAADIAEDPMLAAVR